jgi:hypothetical protein
MGGYRGSMHTLLMLPALLAIGCTADSDSKIDTGLPGDTDTGEDTADVSASFEAEFLVDASGYGTDRLGGVEVVANLASLELSGVTHRGLAYQHHDWQSAGYVLFDLLTVAEDGSNLAVTYLYGRDGALPYAYTESFDHSMDWENTGGSVDWSETSTTVQPDMPALVARPAPLDVGIDISGDALWLEDEVGGVEIEGVSYALLPFATVDCTDCPGGPWLEIHALLEEEGQRDTSALACFGIVYLFQNQPDYAQLSYGLCLPDLSTPEGDFEVSWSGGLSTVRSRAHRAGGPPVGRPPRAR